MSEIDISYKGSTIATMDASGTKTLLTSGKYCEDDIEVVYTRPTAPSPTLQTKSKSYTPTTSQQTESVTADNGYDGIDTVNITVDAMPSGAVTAPSTITGSSATVSTGTNTLTLSKTISVTPSVTTAGYISSGTSGNSAVSLTASVNTRTSSDLSASGATVSVPSGYYASSVSKSVASGTEGTPTATKGTVSSHSVTVTPSVTNTSGYISGGTHSGTPVTVSASELVSGSETKTSNGTYDVTNLASLIVNVSGGGGSSWAKIGNTTEVEVNTTSTSAAVVTYISLGSDYVTKDKVLWVHVRDTSGPRNGYFYGTDSIIMNWRAANGTTGTVGSLGTLYYYFNNNNYTGGAGQYGVYAYSLDDTGTITVRGRYNSSNSRTINSTYSIDVYELTPPTGMILFDAKP